ncbi:MAG: hypothetical protein V4454_18880 [Pseudomonadota bacterium]
MNLLPKAPDSYSKTDQAQLRAALELEDRRNLKRAQNIEVGTAKLVLTSPNGTRYSITVDNSGVISAAAL